MLRTDKQALNWGMLFVTGVALAILLLGAAQAGLALEPNPGIGLAHYEWQLATPTVWSQITIWGGFALHLLLFWWAIYYAQKHYPKYSDGLRPANYWALGINAVFIVAHYVQSLVFYDAMAQYIPSWTAQATVIMMLVVILGMENQRRGMFFGKKVPLKQEFVRWLKEYHPYAFSFAIIYTFWYHPMVPTPGHIFGFLYTMIVLLQGSLMFTRAHLNTRWRFLMEILVLPHAAFVALFQTEMLLWMFTFGFGGMFIVTQMHGLGLKAWVRNTFYAAFALLVVMVYFVVREPRFINEVIRVPAVEFLTLFVIYALWWAFTWTAGKVRGLRVEPQQAAGD